MGQSTVDGARNVGGTKRLTLDPTQDFATQDHYVIHVDIRVSRLSTGVPELSGSSPVDAVIGSRTLDIHCWPGHEYGHRPNTKRPEDALEAGELPERTETTSLLSAALLGS